MAATEPPESILVTGASSGIGRALALEYAAPGRTLFLFGRDPARLESVAAAAAARGAAVHTRIVDTRDADAMRAAIEAADDEAPLDLVVANAGTSSGVAADGVLEGWQLARATLDVNLFGSLNTIAPAIDRMRRRGSGRVALVGSLAARAALPVSPAYSASKAALETLGLALRQVLRVHGVGVSVVSPGFVATPMSDRFRGRRPWMISAEAAARRIRRGLDADRAVVSFPRPLAFGAWIAGWLPDVVRRLVFRPFEFAAEPEAADTGAKEERPSGSAGTAASR